MPLVEIGSSMTDAEEFSKKEREPLPNGPYTLRVNNCEPRTAKSGRPMLNFRLEVAENPNPDYNGKTMFYNCPLPDNGNSKGIGFLVQIVKALGQEWEGTNIKTDEFVGLTCTANVSTDEKGWNQIDSFA